MIQSSFATTFKALFVLGVGFLAICPASAQSSKPSSKSEELLTNGSFTSGTEKWMLEQSKEAKGTLAVEQGPGGKPAAKVTIVAKGDQPWQVQLHQGKLKIEKGRPYTLTYWAKADRPTVITVNCMQNHEPWEHHGAAREVGLTTKWKEMTFAFRGPWNDDNARVTFTNLATIPGQTYWFAKVSLKALSAPSKAKPDSQSLAKKGRRAGDGR